MVARWWQVAAQWTTRENENVTAYRVPVLDSLTCAVNRLTYRRDVNRGAEAHGGSVS
jgi:hypothetical protein